MATRVRPLTAAHRDNRHAMDDEAAWRAITAPFPRITMEVAIPRRGKQQRRVARVEAWGTARALMEVQGELLQRFRTLQARVLSDPAATS